MKLIKYAIQVSEKNYPQIEHKGDVFDANFKEYKGFDLLIGGSPCTYWSIAKNQLEKSRGTALVEQQLFIPIQKEHWMKVVANIFFMRTIIAFIRTSRNLYLSN